MSIAADLYARISPHLTETPLATVATRTHARLIKASRGRVGARLFGAQLLVLQTKGRRSGQMRQSPLFCVSYGHDGYAVLAANAASKHPPAWWFNLQASPEAEVLVAGRSRVVRARAASAEETAELWPRFIEAYSGSERYRSIATRELPVVILEPR